MITEDYVSFEIAKLLKEKGFDYNAEYESYYTLGGEIVYFKDNPQDINIAPRVTLQIAMKWLREVHNIFICIVPSEVGAGVMDYTYVLYSINAENFYFENLDIQGRAKSINNISYEEACDTAIKYCLEKLI